MIWLGTEESLEQYLSIVERASKFGAQDIRAAQHDDDEEENPVQVTNLNSGLSIIHVSGTTVSSSNWMTRMFGVASYGDIRNRIVDAADSPSVKAILLDVNSAGGQAQGVAGLSRFIKTVSTTIKPIFTHTQTHMLSAPMWYATAADSVTADRDAELGSVGAIRLHMEVTEMLKQRGINATVFRSAPFKALGQPEEKLTDTARKEITDSLARMHDAFVNGLSENVGKSPSDVQANIANGKVFTAEQAQQLGLVSRLLSFDEVVAKLSSSLTQ